MTTPRDPYWRRDPRESEWAPPAGEPYPPDPYGQQGYPDGQQDWRGDQGYYRQPPPPYPPRPPARQAPYPGAPAPGYPAFLQPPGGRPPSRRHRGLKIFAGIVGGIVAIAVISSLASHGSGSNTPAPAGSSAPAASSPAAAAAQPAAKPARQTVTFVVTGSPAQVSYGPAGSDLAGSVPMRVTHRLGDPQFYAISAQLNGGGTVTCKILVDGTVISKAVATGSYNIAQCEIDQDPLTNAWEDTNSG
jgi:hypothetical protein